MPYQIEKLNFRELLLPIASAGELITRLDERIDGSAVGAGWIERSHFTDALASVYLDGALVHLEDLVLHDAHMDIRSPTHELVIAHSILRARRQIFANPSNWSLSYGGLATLRGSGGMWVATSASDDRRASRSAPGQWAPAPERKDVSGLPLARQAVAEHEDAMAPGDPAVDRFDAELAEIDAVLARSQAALDGATVPSHRPERDPTIYDEEWDEDARLAEWQDVARATAHLPPVLRAALLLDAWNMLDVLQHNAWLGRLLVAGLLKDTGTTSAHLLTINLGLREVRWERRRGRETRLIAFLEAIAQAGRLGLKEHQRLLTARQQLERKLVGRRSSSKLPQLIELVLSRPLVSTAMIARELKVTPQGAVRLAEELGLRELTGRGRYRAWGVL